MASRNSNTRKRWRLGYQDASGTPDDDILDRAFCTEEAAMAWADEHFVVPLWLDEVEEFVGDNGTVLARLSQRHDL